VTADSFFSRLNPVLVGLLRSPLHFLASAGLMLVTVTGRHSGRRYTIPVGYQRDGEVVTVMVSEARSKQWWRNYSEPGPVTLRIRGREVHGTAHVVSPESEEFRDAAEQTLRRMPWLGRVFHVDYDRAAGLGDEQVAQLGDEIAVVRISLEGEDA